MTRIRSGILGVAYKYLSRNKGFIFYIISYHPLFLCFLSGRFPTLSHRYYSPSSASVPSLFPIQVFHLSFVVVFLLFFFLKLPLLFRSFILSRFHRSSISHFSSIFASLSPPFFLYVNPWCPRIPLTRWSTVTTTCRRSVKTLWSRPPSRLHLIPKRQWETLLPSKISLPPVILLSWESEP